VKKITLINPPWYFAHPSEIILSQNLGIGYLASYLQSQGHQVSVIDALAEGHTICSPIKTTFQNFFRAGLAYDSIINRIPADSDYIGITAPFTNHARIINELATLIKEKLPSIPLIIGGVYPSLLPQHCCNHPVDYVVIGEGELAFAQLIAGENPRTIQGVCLPKQGPLNGQPAEIIQNLDEIPFPARDKLPMSQYLKHDSPRREKLRSISLITSRGCPFDCNFCSIHSITGYSWRKRSPQNVLEEIRSVIARYPVEHIEFEDDNFTLDAQRTYEICDGIEKINRDRRKISWSTPNGVRIETLDKKILQKIKQSNCFSLSLAIESGDPALLNRMHKSIDIERCLEIASLCKELRIKTIAFFMIGYPGETAESFTKTLSLVKRLQKNGVSTFYATVTRAYPGTKLFDECRKKNYSAANADSVIYLGNTITPENSITTPDFDAEMLQERLGMFEKSTVTGLMRFYHRHAYRIKKIIPDRLIQGIKRSLGHLLRDL
jgi:magnesium-protoporphyrin IX monomethyl ester (oxidative) cyclase